MELKYMAIQISINIQTTSLITTTQQFFKLEFKKESGVASWEYLIQESFRCFLEKKHS